MLVAGADHLLNTHAETIRRARVAARNRLVITCVDRASLAAIRSGSGGILREIVPDIVVFDESFVDHAVPFSAFTARRSLFACWNRPGKATFHSTTFQPNTISTLHFMNCLATTDPDFYGRYRIRIFEDVLNDLREGRLRSGATIIPRCIGSFGRPASTTPDVRAAGSFIVVDGRPVFDVVGGVACSIRGHNPADLR